MGFRVWGLQMLGFGLRGFWLRSIEMRRAIWRLGPSAGIFEYSARRHQSAARRGLLPRIPRQLFVEWALYPRLVCAASHSDMSNHRLFWK